MKYIHKETCVKKKIKQKDNTQSNHSDIFQKQYKHLQVKIK